MLENIEFRYDDIITGNSLIIHKSEDTYSISIIKSKYIHKKKAQAYEHIIFDKNTFIKFLLKIKSQTVDSFFSCQCFSEVLRLMYDEDLRRFYILIYDNYYLERPKFLAQEVYIEDIEILDKFGKMVSLYQDC